MPKERAPVNPGWVNNDLDDKFYDDKDYLRIIGFFVINAFRPNRSSKGKTIVDYGWPKNVWKNSSNVGLKDVLLYTAELHQANQSVDTVTGAPINNETFVSTNNLDEMSRTCQKAGLKHDFTRTRDINRIAVYNSERNVMLSVFDHIRNAFAHGRFTIYADGMIAFESGKIVQVQGKKMFDIRARMSIKKDTLMQWIRIIEAGSLDPEVVKQIESIRIQEKEKRKKKSHKATI